MAAPRLYQSGQLIFDNPSGEYLVGADNGNPRNGSLPFTFGTVTVNGTNVVTVADTGVNAGSLILFGLKTVGGTVGAIPTVTTITAGTGFTVTATASDTSVYTYLIIG